MRKVYSFLVIILCSTAIKAQISIVPGQTIREDFNTMPTSAIAMLPPGWRADMQKNPRQRGPYLTANYYTTQAGGDKLAPTARAGIYNFGATANPSDRSVGGLSDVDDNGTVNIYMGLTNNGPETITGFTISFDVEKYRRGSNKAGCRMDLQYCFDSISWFPAGSAFRVEFSGDESDDGYDSAPGETKSVTLKKFLLKTIPPGASIYFAWSCSVTTGTTTSHAQALGIDNIVITAIGESTPSLTASSLSGFGNVCLNTSPAPNSFNLTGTNLNGTPVTVGPLAGYRFSTSATGPFSDELSSSYPGSSLNATIYTQFTPTIVQSYNGNIPVSGGGMITPVTIAATGAGINCTPLLNVTATNATDTTSTSFTANWYKTPGAVSYRLDVSATKDFTDPSNAIKVANWTFPDSSPDDIADTVNSMNTGKTITAVGTSLPTFDVTGATTNAARATRWDNGANTKYWQIEVNTTGQNNLLLSSKQRSSSTGPKDFKIQYRIGSAGTWTDIPSGSVTAGDNFTTGIVAGLALPAECSNQASVFIRWIMTSNTSVSNGTAGSAGASLIDDISITGSQGSFVTGYKDLLVNDTSLPVTGLSPNTTYYYRVRAFNGNTSGPNSNIITVTTNLTDDDDDDTTTTPLPLEVVAVAATDTTPTSFIANWHPAPGAASYHLDVSTTGDFVDDPVIITLANWTFPDPSPDAIADIVNSMNTGKTITAAGTNTPTFDATGATTNAARATGWGNGANSKYWQIEVNTTGQNNLLLSSKQRSSATGPKDFKIQYKIGSAGTWTDIPSGSVTVGDNFTTGVVAGLTLPAECSNQASVFIRWIMTSGLSVSGNDVSSTGASLIDDILISGSQATYVTGYKNKATSDTSLPVTGLSPNTTYYYRVRASDGNYTGPNSNIITVTTLIVAAPVFPTVLQSFSGVRQNDKNVLQWTTATENNNLGFELQRSTDSLNYSPIGFIPSSAPGGMSTEYIDYGFNDYETAGDKQFYRLNQVDLDGNSNFSDTILIRSSKPDPFTIARLYPNPATGTINVMINTQVQEMTTFSITDMAGRRRRQAIRELKTGNNIINLDITGLVPGMYYLNCINTSSGAVFRRKFIVR
ncbi:MAG TPA: T9SS type A sorting domain-containing protein [Chitinophaga sp.]|nr:T9SS type A sorting domain-containing protein [Chitinophaga sp.]